MQVQQSSASFGPVSGYGPQIITTTVNMDSAPTQATALLTGFIVQYSGGDDHHLGQLDVQLNVDKIESNVVTVSVTYGLRDWSDNWDDRYEGQIFFSVIGE